MNCFENVKKNFGFGCMRLPMKDGEVDKAEMCRMVDAFLARGFNYFDTAHGYLGGKSEIAVRECLAERYPRDAFILTDKLTGSYFHSEADIRPFFESQLKACGVEYFDFYLMHSQNKEIFEKFRACNAYETAFALKEEGKVRHVGLSFHDRAEVLDEILTAYPQVDVVQIQLNYVDFEDAAIQSRLCYEVCRKHGKPIIIMEPVKGGSLANFSDDINAKFKAMDKDASIASWAFRWVGSHSNAKVILSGMSNEEQVEDNLKTFSNFKPLNEAEEKMISEIVSDLQGRVQNGCTGCRYCMPCPAGVNIPQNFALWNKYHIYGTYDHVKNAWEKDLKDEEKAKCCVKCGKCEKVCPQHLSIRRDLELAQKDLDSAAAAQE